MLARAALNLTMIVGVLVGYSAISSAVNGERYCLGGNLPSSVPSQTQEMLCTDLAVDTPDVPDLHWRALLP